MQIVDDDHTFGHGKAESLAAPLVGIVVTIVVLCFTLVLVAFQRWVVRRTRSQAIRADMLHY